MGDAVDSVEEILRCPRCRGLIERSSPDARCLDAACPYSSRPFPIASGQPVLIDFERSIFQREDYAEARPTTDFDRPSGGWLRDRLSEVIEGTNEVAPVFATRMIDHLKASTPTPRILVIGGGTIGSGAERLYDDPTLRLVGTDVYASPHTQVVADGHALPFVDECFDGVWIQAVLEHVLEPQLVVDEIHRVLKPDGLVYADTPFMQQVHGEAYDFARFTLSGHRWLFRRFEQISAGTVAGAGVALLWSIKYYVRSLGGRRSATLLTLPWFWVRHLSSRAKRGPNADAASSVYFFGARSQSTLSPRDMPAYYATQSR